MLRFAPSPTSDMHIGNLRVALLNYIVSKQKKEDFIVRIEDIDKDKNIEGKDKEILDILELFGVEYSQVIYQSENFRFHSAMALQLIHEKKAFSCFCSEEWIDKKRDEAKANNKPYKYDDACANLPAELVIDNMNPFTIRINKPATNNINDIDSFVILNTDKTPTYNFACAVDDMLSDISVVIRSEDYLDETPKQEHIRDSLAYNKKIKYTHLPLILNSDGQRMSKEDNGFSVKWLLEEGFLPEAILNYLISMVSSTPLEIFTLQESIEWFSLDNLSSSPARFDINKLREINNKYLNSLDTKELSRYVGFADEEIGSLAKVYLQDVSTTKELRDKIKPIFSEKIIPTEFAQDATLISKIIKDAPYFDEYDDFKNYIIKKSGLNDEDISTPLRFVLTGVSDGVELKEVYKYIKNYIGEIVK